MMWKKIRERKLYKLTPLNRCLLKEKMNGTGDNRIGTIYYVKAGSQFHCGRMVRRKKKKGDYEEGISVQSNDYMGEGSGGEKEEEART